MKDWVTMVDRSGWDQSFVYADSSVDVFDLNDADWLDGFRGAGDGIRKSCSGGRSWSPSEDPAADRGLTGGFCPTIVCSSGPDSGRASTADDRVYQNGFLSVQDGHSSSSSSSEPSGCAELGPGSVAFDSGAFSESSSSSACRTAASEPLTGSARSTAAAAARSWLTTTDAGAAYSRVASFLPSWDAERLESAYRQLAACGFYYGRMTRDEATERLGRRPVGTFLLRDSSDQRYLFSLSVQTCRGTTSIRMSYRSGLFRLDCSAEQEHLMPTFDCPLRLLWHYVRLCSGGGPPTLPGSQSGDAGRGRHSYVLLESSGRRDTPVLLLRPYRETPSPLTHLCRRTVQRALYRGRCAADCGGDAAVDRLQLQPSLKTYLKQYPYDL